MLHSVLGPLRRVNSPRHHRPQRPGTSAKDPSSQSGGANPYCLPRPSGRQVTDPRTTQKPWSDISSSISTANGSIQLPPEPARPSIQPRKSRSTTSPAGPPPTWTRQSPPRVAFESFSRTTRGERVALLTRIVEVCKTRAKDLAAAISDAMRHPGFRRKVPDWCRAWPRTFHAGSAQESEQAGASDQAGGVLQRVSWLSIASHAGFAPRAGRGAWRRAPRIWSSM